MDFGWSATLHPYKKCATAFHPYKNKCRIFSNPRKYVSVIFQPSNVLVGQFPSLKNGCRPLPMPKVFDELPSLNVGKFMVPQTETTKELIPNIQCISFPFLPFSFFSCKPFSLKSWHAYRWVFAAHRVVVEVTAAAAAVEVVKGFGF